VLVKQEVSPKSTQPATPAYTAGTASNFGQFYFSNLLNQAQMNPMMSMVKKPSEEDTSDTDAA
jgi:hypothetical protein